MKKNTFVLFALFITSGMLIHAQSSLTTTKVMDISGVESWDSQGSPNNVILTILLDDFASRTDCEDPVLELTGIGWSTSQTTVGGSWLSEMAIGTDANQDGVNEIFLRPGIADTNSGSGTYASDGVLSFAGAGLPDSLIANTVTGSMNLEFYETYNDFTDAVDGMYNAGSTITLQYRLSCSNILGVDETRDLGSVAMYPSVVKDVVTFSNPKFVVLQQAQIYDVFGKLIQTIDLSDMSTEKSFDISALASANYIVKIQTETGNIVKRLIKK